MVNIRIKKGRIFSKLLENIIYSGKAEGISVKGLKLGRTQYAIFNSFIIVGLIATITFFLIDVFNGNLKYISLEELYADIAMVSIICIFLIVARTKIHLIIPSTALVLLYCVFCGYMIYITPYGTASALWYYLIPFLSFFLLGSKLSTVTCILMFAFMTYVFAASPRYYYPKEFIGRFSNIYIYSVVLAFVAYNRLQFLTNSLFDSKKILQDEHKELSAMKDNLNLSVFMLDDNFLIQPLYSKKLPKIFEKEKLDFFSFSELFIKSLSSKDFGLLNDYLDMLIMDIHNSDLLDSINPLEKCLYISDSGKKKFLSIKFTCLSREDSRKYLIGTVSDITSKVEMEARLAEEESLRQEEKNLIFEIMNTTPQVLKEYINELKYELKEVEKIIKKTELPTISMIQDIYQCVHGIKSNALIIGLDTFADKLHSFESKLKDKIEKIELNNTDLNDIELEMIKIKDTYNTFKHMLKKIQLFTPDSSQPSSSKDLLLISLESALKKALENTEKKARLKIKKLEWENLSVKHHRTIREIVLQLIRNAVYHGIEDVERRREIGKPEEAHITLSVEREQTKVRITFSDNGRGIDFDKIKSQLIQKNSLLENTDINDRKFLIKTLFGHGFSTAADTSLQAGRGVGLSLVSDRVKKNQGSITVHTKANVGTKFTIELADKIVTKKVF